MKANISSCVCCDVTYFIHCDFSCKLHTSIQWLSSPHILHLIYDTGGSRGILGIENFWLGSRIMSDICILLHPQIMRIIQRQWQDHAEWGISSPLHRSWIVNAGPSGVVVSKKMCTRCLCGVAPALHTLPWAMQIYNLQLMKFLKDCTCKTAIIYHTWLCKFLLLRWYTSSQNGTSI